MHQIVVATHEGSGLSSVERIFEELGAILHVITSVDEAREALFDRVILLGGADIGPSWYGESVDGAHAINRDRDAIEWTLVRRALSDRIPTLGICRGHQMLAVASGGSLYQDLSRAGFDHYGESHDIYHVSREINTHLPTHRVNSYHHQAVRTMPAGFDVAAVSKDGIIESIYRPGYLGVQFHPEFLAGRDQRWLGLFRWLLDGLGAQKERRRPVVPVTRKEPDVVPSRHRGLFDDIGRVRIPRTTHRSQLHLPTVIDNGVKT